MKIRHKNKDYQTWPEEFPGDCQGCAFIENRKDCKLIEKLYGKCLFRDAKNGIYKEINTGDDDTY